VEGETGYLVPLEEMQESPFEPVDPDQFSRDLLNESIDGRRKVTEEIRLDPPDAEKFGWATIAAETKKMYESLRPTRS